MKDYLLKERQRYLSAYNHMTENFKKYHLLLNASAASALAIFYLTHKNADFLTTPIYFFLGGTLISILAIFLDFYHSYWRLTNFDNNFSPYNKENWELVQIKKRYEIYESSNKGNQYQTVNVRILNGIFSYFLFLIGLSHIVYKKTNPSMAVLIIAAIGLLLYGYCLSWYIRVKTKI